MWDVIRNAWKIEDLRKKILYTLFMLLIFRLGSYIPVPGVNSAVFQSAVANNGILNLLDLFNGGSLSNYTIFAAGITPYITASIVIQLLTAVIPKLEALQKEGPEGQKKVQQIVRYIGIAMAFIQSMAITISVGSSALSYPAWYFYLMIGIIQAAGSAICMWLGERITENGIGNGISLLIFINIVTRVPAMLINLVMNVKENPASFWTIPLAIIVVLLIIVSLVFIDMGQRRIPVRYAKRVVGRKQYGGQSTYIPMKVNNGGVLPIIFGLTLTQFPLIILQFWPNAAFTLAYAKLLGPGTILYVVLTALLIVFFSFFYSTISFNPIEMSKNLQQYGGFVPGIRPGRPTSDYLAKINYRITTFSAIFLAILASGPLLFRAETGSYLGFGATSIMILVSVALETSKQLESQLMLRHYKGFLK